MSQAPTQAPQSKDAQANDSADRDMNKGTKPDAQATPPATSSPPDSTVQLDTSAPSDAIIRQLQEEVEKLRLQNEAIARKATDREKSAIIQQIGTAGFKTDGFDRYTLDQLEAIAKTLQQTNQSIVIGTKKESKATPLVTVFNPETGKHEPFYKTGSGTGNSDSGKTK